MCLLLPPATKFAKVMFLHPSVILFTGGGRAWQRGMRGSGGSQLCVAEGMHGRERGACMGWGHAWQGGVHGTHAPRQILRDTVNERVVHILLECILVFSSFPFRLITLLQKSPFNIEITS